MKMTEGNAIAIGRSLKLERETPALSPSDRIIRFYEEASMDYAHWSRGLNMHLGFFRWGMNPFDREAMLEQLNIEVAKRLELDRDTHSFLVDLGCGMGGVARSIAREYPRATIKGVTLAPSQVRIASSINAEIGLKNRVEILNEDYANLPLEDGIADAAWGVESVCYATGPEKADLVREAARVLKTGGRFVVADCFVTNPAHIFNPLITKCYSTVCDAWAVPEMATLELFVAAMESHGFANIVIEDASWRAAPSLAHAPFAVLTFVIKNLLAGKKLKKHSINNLKASLLALVLGAHRSKFSYCLVSATRGPKA
jgi:MPBQ/MSBQ methyltransferase